VRARNGQEQVHRAGDTGEQESAVRSPVP
jgi:hypothetical protein